MSTTPTDENLLDSSKGDDDSLSSPTNEAAPASPISAPLTEEMLEQQKQVLEWKEELLKVEGEILTLRQVLGSKVRHATELKRKIGITPFQEFKTDFSSGLQHIKSSDSYQKTNDKLLQMNDKIVQSTAYQKTAAMSKTVGEKTSAAFTSVTRRLGDLRNSNTFKSLEESVGHTYASVRARVSGSRSSTSLDEHSEEMKTDQDYTPLTPGDLPEEKIPL